MALMHVGTCTPTPLPPPQYQAERDLTLHVNGSGSAVMTHDCRIVANCVQHDEHKPMILAGD